MNRNDIMNILVEGLNLRKDEICIGFVYTHSECFIISMVVPSAIVFITWIA